MAKTTRKATSKATHSPSAPAPADGSAIPIISEDYGPNLQEPQPATLEELRHQRETLRSQLADLKQHIQAVDADIAAIVGYRIQF